MYLQVMSAFCNRESVTSRTILIPHTLYGISPRSAKSSWVLAYIKPKVNIAVKTTICSLLVLSRQSNGIG
jgi:hypothetical protein